MTSRNVKICTCDRSEKNPCLRGQAPGLLSSFCIPPGCSAEALQEHIVGVRRFPSAFHPASAEQNDVIFLLLLDKTIKKEDFS